MRVPSAQAMPTFGGLMKHVTVTSRCLGCKAAIKTREGESVGAALCVSCTPRQAEIYLGKLAHLRSCERMFHMTQTECQRITGSIHKDVVGIARDSQIFYMMKKARKDLDAAKEVIARFDVEA
jgi:DNA polymerase delta subunit 1